MDLLRDASAPEGLYTVVDLFRVPASVDEFLDVSSGTWSGDTQNLPAGFARGATSIMFGMRQARSAPDNDAWVTAAAMLPPYLLLWRHAIELQLKVILTSVINWEQRMLLANPPADDGTRASRPGDGTWADMVGHPPPSKAPITHGLKSLWNDVRPMVAFADGTFRNTHADSSTQPTIELITFEALLDDLHRITPRGDEARYTVSTQGVRTLLGLPSVHLEWAQAQFVDMFCYLGWAYICVQRVQSSPEQVQQIELQRLTDLRRDLLPPASSQP